MSHPLGYYTNFTPGDGSTLDDLEDMFGSNLEKLSDREKLFLIRSLASHLCTQRPGELRASVQVVTTGIIQELQTRDIEGLIEALIAQVRWGQNATTVHHS